MTQLKNSLKVVSWKWFVGVTGILLIGLTASAANTELPSCGRDLKNIYDANATVETKQRALLTAAGKCAKEDATTYQALAAKCSSSQKDLTDCNTAYAALFPWCGYKYKLTVTADDQRFTKLETALKDAATRCKPTDPNGAKRLNKWAKACRHAKHDKVYATSHKKINNESVDANDICRIHAAVLLKNEHYYSATQFKGEDGNTDYIE